MGNVCYAVPVTDRQFTEVEFVLNCLEYAYTNTLRIHACFLDKDVSRLIVEDFVNAWESAEGCSLYTRIKKLCNALYIALQSINAQTGRRPSYMPTPYS